MVCLGMRTIPLIRAVAIDFLAVAAPAHPNQCLQYVMLLYNSRLTVCNKTRKMELRPHPPDLGRAQNHYMPLEQVLSLEGEELRVVMYIYTYSCIYIYIYMYKYI